MIPKYKETSQTNKLIRPLVPLTFNKHIVIRYDDNKFSKVFAVVDENDEYYFIALDEPPYECLQFRKERCQLIDLKPIDNNEKVPYEKLVELLTRYNCVTSSTICSFDKNSIGYSELNRIREQVRETLDKM